MAKPVVGIIMGSDSDLVIMQEAAKVLEELGVEYELTITSAHRTTDVTVNYGRNALEKGLKVLIAGAGGAAHLPGMVAGMTPLPVIGVPIRAKNLEGLDSLLSIVQMPAGIPVATVAINGARNAGILAAQIIGTGDGPLQEKVKLFQTQLADQVMAKAKKLETIGYEAYLKEQN